MARCPDVTWHVEPDYPGIIKDHALARFLGHWQGQGTGKEANYTKCSILGFTLFPPIGYFDPARFKAMFKWIGGLSDCVCAVAGALVFLQAPLFIQQYKQQLSGHVSELQLQVEVMRQTAMQSGKTLDQFTNKFIDNSDPDFSRQGEIMKNMVDRWHQLSDAFTALNNASILTKPFAFLSHFNLTIAKEAAHSYTLEFL